VESLVVPPLTSDVQLEKVDGYNTVKQGRILAWYWPLEAQLDVPPIQLPRQPDITKVCRQIRDETLPIFYGVNRVLILDQCYHAYDGVKTPFLNIL
jgi:hypothetical protein